jgi:branched-chain amino acid transport system substrate-binding protein
MRHFCNMTIRALAFSALFTIVTATASLGAANGPPYNIPVILSLTGAGAFIGHSDAVALGAVEELTNKSGGIRGRPVHFEIVDDQSNPALAVQLTSGFIGQHVAVMLGPSGSGTCSAILPIVNKAGPVTYCVSPSIHPAPNSFIFSTSMAVRDSVGGALVYFHTRGWHKIALLTSTDATGQEGEDNVKAALLRPENRDLTLVDNEHFNVTDLSVSAQIARIQASAPDVLIAWTTGTPFGLVLKQLSQSGMDVPVLSNSGNAITAQMEQYTDIMPKQLYFSSMVGLGVSVVRPGPIHNALTQFDSALKARDVTVDNGYIFAWDPAMILIDALRHIGPDASAVQVRDYIEGLHGFAGINGIYDFRDGSQRGLGINTEMVVRYDPATKRWIPVTRPGGQKLATR